MLQSLTGTQLTRLESQSEQQVLCGDAGEGDQRARNSKRNAHGRKAVVTFAKVARGGEEFAEPGGESPVIFLF